MLRALIEGLMRLPTGLYYGLMIGAPLLGTVFFVLGLVLAIRNKRTSGLALVVIGVGGWTVAAGLFAALVLDVVCTGRSGDWIC